MLPKWKLSRLMRNTLDEGNLPLPHRLFIFVASKIYKTRLNTVRRNTTAIVALIKNLFQIAAADF